MRWTVNTQGKSNWAKLVYTAFALCAATAVALSGQSVTTFTTLHSFDGTDGKQPEAALIQTTNGDLYGITVAGGVNGLPNAGGTAFKIAPSGAFKTVHNFCSQTNSFGDCLDGLFPQASLLQVSNGGLYGTTYNGGDNTNCANECGIVFTMTLSGTVTPIYDFCPQGTGNGENCADGENPLTALVEAPNGHFYGTTQAGGSKCAGFPGCGTVFAVTAGGTLNTLYSFCEKSGCPDGASPSAGLMRATDGDFYGTTRFGGVVSSACDGAGCGTVFKITAGGTLTTLYSFCAASGCPDGASPVAAVIQATNGDIYGVTPSGGANGAGTIFQIANATFSTLYSFCSETKCKDGSSPTGLIQGSDGNFYGTTTSKGANGKGTVFELTSGGKLTTLDSFCANANCTDGASPNALVQDTNGTFYGTAYAGGANNDGAVFSVSTGLGPFVETLTTSGAVGASVTILGTDLTGATSVTFNGTAAVFTVVSSSEITTTVPAGATTGTVEVATPKGTLSSNAPFRVT
jgi:uncharacterized repeat protein (TIGR03803 family)